MSVVLEEQCVHAAASRMLALDAFDDILAEDDLARGEDLGLEQVAADRIARGFRREDVEVRVDLAGVVGHEVPLEAQQVEWPVDAVHGHPRLGDRHMRDRLDVAEINAVTYKHLKPTT